MSRMPAGLRRRVIRRASGRCEYCGLHQSGQEATFHIDHAIPIDAGGPTSFDNLALDCVSCLLRKAARTTAVDPRSGDMTLVYNPRTQEWASHFRWKGLLVAGRTATGRATVDALQMNRPLILAIRAEEALRGRHPP